MRLALRKPGQCAFCTLETSNAKWSTPSVQLQWQRGARRNISGNRPGNRNGNRFSRDLGNNDSRDSAWEKGNRSDPDDQHSADARSKSAYSLFAELVWKQCEELKKSVFTTDRRKAVAWGINSDHELRYKLADFTNKVHTATKKAVRKRQVSEEDNPLFYHLRQAFIKGSVPGLAAEVQFRFLSSTLRAQRSGKRTTNLQKKLADIAHPIEWFPGTRALQRTIHLHVGPTNSGKTYHALKRLEGAKTGIYAGPLRLLAHEVYTRLNASGKKCALITGEEYRIPEGPNVNMSSCTVEMVPVNTDVEVAVIDEIQMIASPERGWAWTQAFLGVRAKEVHLCGEVRTVHLIKKLCATMGDKLVIHNYKRLGPLQPERASLKSLDNIKPGDAVILFSRVAIHAMKKKIEKMTGKRCAVVYGSLPPETRAQQAALFNDPNNDYDYLVASDAVGMGLNLNIRRIIFESTMKFDGMLLHRLEPALINQIAGRAGRFKTAHEAIRQEPTKESSSRSQSESLEPKSRPNIGYVTTLRADDLPIVQKALQKDATPIKTAGITPPAEILTRFAALFPPNTPFSYIVLRLNELASLNPDFHLCRKSESIALLDLIQPYKMSVLDRITFMGAPVNLRAPKNINLVIELAKCVANNTGGELITLRSLNLELIDQDIHDDPQGVKGYLREAETLHLGLTLYLWLSYRFAGVFRSQALAFHVKALIEEKIGQCLAEVDDSLSWSQRQYERKNLRQQYDRARELEEGGFGWDDEGRDVEREDDVKNADNDTVEHDLEDPPFFDGDTSTPGQWENMSPESTAARV